MKTPDPTWDLYSPPAGSDVPARRTGHVCITHGDKIYLYVFRRYTLPSPIHSLVGSEAQTVNTITTIHGPLTSPPAHGANCPASASSPSREKATQLPWWTTSCTSSAVEVWTARTWAISRRSKYPVCQFLGLRNVETLTEIE